MKLDCALETRQKKDGTGSYECIVIKITDQIEKLVFLSDAEKELLKLRYKSKSNDFDWLEP